MTPAETPSSITHSDWSCACSGDLAFSPFSGAEPGECLSVSVAQHTLAVSTAQVVIAKEATVARICSRCLLLLVEH